jgi:hypothetical protein
MNGANRRVLLAILFLATALFSLAYLPASTPSKAQGASRYFSETGQTVSGRFLDYWSTHGGLAQQGYPISGEVQEVSDTDGKTYTVQYFERAVFELHPENPAPNDVLLSLLGVFLYKQKYPNGAPGQLASIDNAITFPQTGHSLGSKFRAYWESHGGLAQQGYPISDEFSEVSELDGMPYRVQYFERAVFEYHPEYAGTPYEVLLSQLGTFRRRAKQVSAHAPATQTSVPSSPTAPIEPPTPTTSNVPNASDLEKGAVRVFGPVNGSLPHNGEDNYVSESRAGVSLRNFVTEARFYNPYAASFHSWDYGFTFRRPDSSGAPYSQYRVGVTSNKAWKLTLGLGDGPYGWVADMVPRQQVQTWSRSLRVTPLDGSSSMTSS